MQTRIAALLFTLFACTRMRLIETEINELKLVVLEMAEHVQLQMELLTKALHQMDTMTLDKIRKKEKEIDAFDTNIDRRCARIMALYQPVANDLRFVFSAVKINGYLEQIGDLVNYVARKTMKFEEPLDPALLEELKLRDMLIQSNEILGLALNAFFTENPGLARSVFPLDDAVDEQHRQNYITLARYCQLNPENAATYIQLALNQKNIEKMADLGVAIAEEALFNTDAVIYRHSDIKSAHRREQVPGPQSDTMGGAAMPANYSE